jgi:hypothetical protein
MRWWRVFTERSAEIKMGIGPEIRLYEIAVAVWAWYPDDIPDEAIRGWRTPRDVVGDIVARANSALDETEVLTRVRQLIAEGWDIPLDQVTPEVELIDAGLRLADRPFMHPSGGSRCDPTFKLPP